MLSEKLVSEINWLLTFRLSADMPDHLFKAYGRRAALVQMQLVSHLGMPEVARLFAFRLVNRKWHNNLVGLLRSALFKYTYTGEPLSGTFDHMFRTFSECFGQNSPKKKDEVVQAIYTFKAQLQSLKFTLSGGSS